MIYINHERLCLNTFPNTDNRVQYTMYSRVVLMMFEVFGNVVKQCIECLIYLLNWKKTRRKWREKKLLQAILITCKIRYPNTAMNFQHCDEFLTSFEMGISNADYRV